MACVYPALGCLLCVQCRDGTHVVTKKHRHQLLLLDATPVQNLNEISDNLLKRNVKSRLGNSRC